MLCVLCIVLCKVNVFSVLRCCVFVECVIEGNMVGNNERQGDLEGSMVGDLNRVG